MNDRTWELMTKHLEAGDYSIFSSQQSAPSAKVLRDTAKRLDCKFPDEFIAHASNEFGGIYIEVNEEIWPRAKEFDVGPFWSFLYGLYTFNIAKGIPDFMDLAENARQFQEDTQLKAVPFLKVIGDADVYCFDKSGKIVRYNHELNELEPESKSFFELLDYELSELAQRKKQKKALLRSAKKKFAKKKATKKKPAKKSAAKTKASPRKAPPKKKK
jgi:hypothetical protein